MSDNDKNKSLFSPLNASIPLDDSYLESLKILMIELCLSMKKKYLNILKMKTF